MQPQLTAVSEDYNHTGGLPQLAGLRQPPHHAGNLRDGREITCIPNNTDKYISFSLGQLRFIDSAQFMLSSLDKLVKACDQGDMRITAEFEPNPERRALLIRKGVYPYESIDDLSGFLEVTLPQKDAFYSKLSLEGISDEDYAHGQKVWENFG